MYSVKGEGRENDLIDRLQADPAFAGGSGDNVLDPTRYIGLAPQQTREYLRKTVRPLLKRNPGARDKSLAVVI